MPKWPACSQGYFIPCSSYCFPNQFRYLSSMSAMNKPLKHPQRLYFLNSVDTISKTLFQESVSTEKTISVNVTRDHFTFSRCWQKIQWETVDAAMP